jgi:hypothetical protein
VAVGGVDVVMPQRPLPARAEEEEEERCGGSGAFGDAFGSASAVCEVCAACGGVCCAWPR